MPAKIVTSGSLVTVEESKTAGQDDQAPELIPYELRLLRSDEAARNILQTTSSSTSSTSNFPATGENTIAGRIQPVNLTEAPSEDPQTISALLQEMTRSSLLSSEMQGTLTEWEGIFTGYSEDLQSQVDLLAILVLQIIRPTLMSFPRGSPQQMRTLAWERAVQNILNQTYSISNFDEMIDESEDRLLEARIAKADSEAADQTLATQNEVFSNFFTEINQQITQVFLTLRESLIILQQARSQRMMEQNTAALEITLRAQDAGQGLLTEAAAVAELADRIHAGDQEYQNSLSYCRIVVARCQ